MAFNTAPFHGKKARIEKNDTAMDFTDGWTIDQSVGMADTSRQGQDWTEGEPGQGSWTGSFSGQFVAGNTEQKAIMDNITNATPGTKLTDVIFLLDTSANGYTGDIFITGYSVTSSVGDKVSFTATFQGNGALSLSSST